MRSRKWRVCLTNITSTSDLASPANVDRVPEDKCHMVLPEIEEEFEDEDEAQKLSLTSLLLGDTMT